MKRKKFEGCYTCRGKKEPERNNQANCKKCHAEYMKQQRAEQVSVNASKLIDLMNGVTELAITTYFKNILSKKGFKIN